MNTTWQAGMGAVWYAAVALLAARWCYARYRPSTAPLYCRSKRPHELYHSHGHDCYRRFRHGNYDWWRNYTVFDDNHAVAWLSLLAGLLWPLLTLVMFAQVIGRGIVTAVTSGAPELPAERHARIARMEHETGIGQDGDQP